MKSVSVLSLLVVLGSLSVLAETNSQAPLYATNFEHAEPGKVPDDFLILEGGFVVKEQQGNKFLELPGAPLDSFGVLFGPAATSNVVVSARINSTAKGRRFPTFGVGLNGVAGYKLQVSPAKSLLELYRDQHVKASAPYQWKSGEWTMLRLQLRAAQGGEWKIEGKAWAAGVSEPTNWTITFSDKEKPPAGRPSLFASPFSGAPIQFDDLVVSAASQGGP